MGAVSSVYTIPLQHRRPQTSVNRAQEENIHEPDLTIIQPEIHNETPEEKINRLEKTLALERQEKWDAIALSERRRVQLINYKKGVLLKESDFYDENNEAEEEEEEERPRTAPEELHQDETDEDLRSFQIRLQQFREARLKAVSDKSKELNDLRESIKVERELRKIAEMKLATIVLSAHTVHDEDISKHLIEQNLILHRRIEKLRNDIEAENLARQYDEKLTNQMNKLKRQVCQLQGKTERDKLEMVNLRKTNERLVRDLELTMTEKERLEIKLRDFDEEQKRAWESYDIEKAEIAKRTTALKEVIEVSREMLAIREQQVVDLKAKLSDIEQSVEERNRLDGSHLKVEYEKQLENIKDLKELYAQRMVLMEAEKNNLNLQIAQNAKKIENLNNELSDLKLKYEMAAEEADSERQKNAELAAEGSILAAQARGLQRELTTINQMLTRMLLGRSPAELDRLGELLQQNHGLISCIASNETYNDVAASLPKLLLDLIAQVDEKDSSAVVTDCVDKFDLTDPMTDSTDTLSGHSDGLAIVSYKNATIFKTNQNKPSAIAEDSEPTPPTPEPYHPPADMDPVVQEIVNNLPKVWRVLTELLSQQVPVESPAIGEDRTCYKSVDTPQGPKNVISVSKTFLKLKDLILEKKSLTQEVCRLKHLNTHLETRLDEQEKRLSTVQCELHKTWGVVGKMRAQHQQLHNQEKILRYELQEKRLMLSELKDELAVCRDKWQKARQKNIVSEGECSKLRQEFAARKLLRLARDSHESGYSDGANTSSDTDRSSSSSPVPFVAELTEKPQKDNCTDMAKISEPTADGGLKPEGSSEAIASRIDSENQDEEAERVAEGNRNRQTRLLRLEEQCQLLVRKVEITNHKSNFLSNRLEELHDHYSGQNDSGGGKVVTDAEEIDEKTENAEVDSISGVEVSSNVCQEVNGATCLNYFSQSSETLPTEIQPEKTDLVCSSSFESLREARLESLVEESSELLTKSPDAANPSIEENENNPVFQENVFSKTVAEISSTEDVKVDDLVLKTEMVKSAEERANAREERLKRLEEESGKLLQKTKSTIQKSDKLSEHLEELHQECSKMPSSSETILEVIDSPIDGGKKDVSRMEMVNQNSSSAEERAQAREERLKRLEEESGKLLQKTKNTIQRSDNLSEQLDELHREYSEKPGSSNNSEETTESSIGLPVDNETSSVNSVDKVVEAVETPSLSSSEERARLREERLRRLEEESTLLLRQTRSTLERGSNISQRLQNLHEQNVSPSDITDANVEENTKL